MLKSLDNGSSGSKMKLPSLWNRPNSQLRNPSLMLQSLSCALFCWNLAGFPFTKATKDDNWRRLFEWYLRWRGRRWEEGKVSPARQPAIDQQNQSSLWTDFHWKVIFWLKWGWGSFWWLFVQGVFFHWYPHKSSKYKKVNLG